VTKAAESAYEVATPTYGYVADKEALVKRMRRIEARRAASRR